jgi:histone acetyltransferase (RNA polymerase elongator complex component)
VKKHANVAIFVPHQGCPGECVFCDQRAISGGSEAPSPHDVVRLLEEGKRTLGPRVGEAEIAFFGGSFTAIDPEYRKSLLMAAEPYLGKDSYAGIRVSTRPDAVDRKILVELKGRGVTAIELGAQSMDNTVLIAAGRGHTARHTEEASRLIKEAGFSLGLQMMTGLPGDSDEGALETARRFIALKPDTVRIYPALVLKGTRLEELYRAGSYTPQSLREAVSLCARLLGEFTGAGVRVIRLGLHAGESLARRIAAGPWHPALRDLAEGEVMLKKARLAVALLKPGPVELFVEPGGESRMAGQRRVNLRALEDMGYPAVIRPHPGLGYLQVMAADGK